MKEAMQPTTEDLLRTIPTFDPERVERNMRVSFEDLRIEMEVDENISQANLYNQIYQYITNNLEQIVEKSKAELLPIGSLQRDTVYIGQIVRVTETQAVGFVQKINRQNIRAVTVRFPAGETQIYCYHELQRTSVTADQLDIKTSPYSGNPADIKNGHVLYIDTKVQQGYAVVTLNRKADRAKAHFITHFKMGQTRYMSLEDFHSIILSSEEALEALF